MTTAQPTEDEIRAELERILSSRSFEQAERHKRFLSFVVDESLAGRGDRLKGYAIAISVFDRPEDFDPQADPLVRVEAGRLRKRLAEYYANEGSDDPVHVSIPRGTYKVRFNFLEQNLAPTQTMTSLVAGGSRRGVFGLILLAGFSGAAIALLAVLSPRLFPVAESNAPADAAAQSSAAFPDWPRVFIAAFTDISDVEDYSNFAYGISEEISLLIGEYELLIIAERPALAANRELPDPVPLRSGVDADYVLTGTVRSDGEGARITVRLAETDTGTLIWSETYDESLSAASLLQTEQDLARRIVRAVAVPYGPIYERELVRRGDRPLSEVSSYDCVLKFHEYRREIDSSLRTDAESCFQSVLDRGEAIAETSAGLAIIKLDEFVYGPDLYSGSEQLLDFAGEHARRALDLDSDSYLAHLALMRVRFHGGDVEGAWESAARVIELGPENPIGLSVVSSYRLLAGLPATGPVDPDNLIAIEVDPRGHYFVPLTVRALTAGDYEEALDYALRIDTPNWFGGPMFEAATASLAGRSGIAERSLAQMIEIGPGNQAEINLVLDRFNVDSSLRATLLRGLQQAGLPSD